MTPPRPAQLHEEFLAWFPVVSKYAGLVGLAFVTVFWALTQEIEPLLLGMFGTLLGLSQGTDALKTLRESEPETTVATTLPQENGGTA